MMRVTPIRANLYNFNSRYRVNQRFHRENADSVNIVDLTKSSPLERIQSLYPYGVDFFTGMRDKTSLLSTLSNMMNYSQKNGSNISIAMFDMDNFKSINELLGYETGDDFIKVISNNISNVAKKNKLGAFRFGGEEFVIIFSKETPEKKKEIVDSIISSINSDKFIKSKESKYLDNAKSALNIFSSSSTKINSIISLRERKGILDELSYNFSTQEAKNDRYFNQKREDTEYELQCAYLSLINDSIEQEPDQNIKNWLIETRDKLSRTPRPSRQDEERINEYLRTKYDKTQEVYQLKKWISDFRLNNGFSITGAVATFTPDSIKGKKPINLINDAGEILKRGKFERKGIGYFSL